MKRNKKNLPTKNRRVGREWENSVNSYGRENVGGWVPVVLEGQRSMCLQKSSTDEKQLPHPAKGSEEIKALRYLAI